MSSLGSPNPFFIAGKKAYEVERSLRFNDGDSVGLSRTPSSSGNTRTFTISAWVKRSSFGSGHTIFSVGPSGSNLFALYFPSGQLSITEIDGGSQHLEKNSTALFRDTSAWLHVVGAIDTTQSTAEDRIIIYVNGVRITDYAANTIMSQNTDLIVNSTNTQYIGRMSTGNYFDGYLAEFNFIDGLQLTPSSFAETDPLTGQWNPKKYIGSYGTNGFYLNFSDNSGTTATTLGKDYSGNGNNFTPNNFSVAAGVGNDSVIDTPTNNFPTFNAVDPGQGSSVTLSNGNMDITTATGSSTTYSNFVIPKTGKWFMEATMTNNGPNYAPIIQATNYIGMTTYTYTNSNLRYYINGEKRLDGTWSSYGATFTQNDVIGVAVDVDNNEVTYYKNGASQGAISFTFASGIDYFFAASDGSSFDPGAYSWNFGQRPFVYTQPTGFKTICSANLPDPTIKLPDKHFNTLLYTGNGGTQSITGLEFQPDWVWLKKRNGTTNHLLFDIVRGTNKSLNSNTNGAEDTSSTNKLTSFNSDGFTLGSNGSGNNNSDTFVAWNWNAGDTEGKTYTVTVVSDSGNKYRFDGYGTSAVTLDLAEGGTYIFDQSDSSNSGHPLRFYTAADKTGGEYTTGVTTAGTPGSSGAYTQIVVAASAPTLYYQCSAHAGMGGAINTNSTLGSSNFDGTIQTTVKVNATAGFSIISYTGTGSDGTLGHGLGVAPSIYIVKRRNSAKDWYVQIGNLAGIDLGRFVKLNTTDGLAFGGGTVFAASADTSTVLNTKGDTATNGSGDTYINYCFSEVAGYSKFGRYDGNNNADGTFVFTGFRPAWVMIKRYETTRDWIIYDNKRSTFNVIDDFLEPNNSTAEQTSSSRNVDFLSNGFKFRGSDGDMNGAGDYIYFAFAEAPFKNARAR